VALALATQMVFLGSMSVAAVSIRAAVVLQDVDEDVACPHHRGLELPCMKHCPMHGSSKPSQPSHHSPPDQSDVDGCFLLCPSDSTLVVDLGTTGLLVDIDVLAIPDLVIDATPLVLPAIEDPSRPVLGPPPRA
jgi:hypothetical protein